MNRARLQELLSRFSQLRIVVAGDLFLDRWYEIDTQLNEPSLETGLTAYQIVKKRSAAGAAGTVLNNLSEMGIGHLEVISLVGEDGDGWEMLQRLNERGVDTSKVLQSDRVVTPAYIKPLFPEEGNRFDVKNFSPTPEDLQEEIIRRIEASLADADALVLLEQVCEVDTGVITSHVRNAIRQMALRHPDKLIYADSRAFIHLYRDVVIKCNNLEAARMTGREADEEHFDREEVFRCMDELKQITHRPVIITCNRHGVAVEEGGKKLLVPAVRHSCPIDICGAGDACTAGLVSALCAGGSYAEAAFLGNLSSGVTVRQIGRTGAAGQEAMLRLYDEQWKEE
ncbi:MAG TPA: carbohydrate kinase [Candidatus Pullichristensenella excrementigallinarum]|uniref:Carbohydrate kinase n=1 Tax=Candidatus Pullichristensenella excrementigallinarum TaxID=2840907 RepID=A0A9D1I9R4_9FIRM|nr:carbohydrate kinase [Candidatus Pullichristensenella excrementigallinarum]